jgi:MFS transporter, ACS family, tartrate transporter
MVTGSTSFAIVRFLLGVAEAGFFPGLILYFTYWFPRHHHARIVSCFLIGLPVAVAVGAPISTSLLGLDGLFGLRGWQVMYVAEAIPTLVVGVLTFFVLTDRPEQAKFLSAEERNWLVAKIASERRAAEAVRTFTLWQAMYNPKVLLLALNYFGIVTASLGMLIFVPQIVKSLGNYNNMTVGWLTMIPYICGAVAMVVWGRISDRMNERRWNLFIGCVFSTVGLVIAGVMMGTWWALVGMSIAAMGFYGSKGPFFAMPPMFLSGTGLAAGIAWINSIGNLGGFFGPWYVGVMKDLTGSYAGGLYGLALLGFVAAIVCAFFLHIPSHTSSVAPPVAAAAG